MLASRQSSPATAHCNLYKVQSVAIHSAPTKGIANFFLPFLNCVVSPSTRSLRSCRSLLASIIVVHRSPSSFRRISFYFYFCSISIFYFYSNPLFPPSNISCLELGGTPVRPRARAHPRPPPFTPDQLACTLRPTVRGCKVRVSPRAPGTGTDQLSDPQPVQIAHNRSLISRVFVD